MYGLEKVEEEDKDKRKSARGSRKTSTKGSVKGESRHGKRSNKADELEKSLTQIVDEQSFVMGKKSCHFYSIFILDEVKGKERIDYDTYSSSEDDEMLNDFTTKTLDCTHNNTR